MELSFLLRRILDYFPVRWRWKEFDDERCYMRLDSRPVLLRPLSSLADANVR